MIFNEFVNEYQEDSWSDVEQDILDALIDVTIDNKFQIPTAKLVEMWEARLAQIQMRPLYCYRQQMKEDFRENSRANSFLSITDLMIQEEDKSNESSTSTQTSSSQG